jgi:hypothetical protein
MERDSFDSLGAFDAVVMIESLDHVFDKLALLAKLTQVTSRLVFVTNCTVVSMRRPLLTFGDTMAMISSDVLLRMLKKTGWAVRSVSDDREFSMPTFEHWKTRIEAADPSLVKPPLRLLHGLCEIALQDVRAFQDTFPLLTVCAELEPAKEVGV